MMDTAETPFVDDQSTSQKKGRHRKKQLYNSIMQQMEFYFSDSNLSKDKFLLPLVENNSDIDISIFFKFNKIRKLTSSMEDIVKAVHNSQLLELSEDKTKVRRKTPINIRENVDNCTLYVERIKVDTTHEWLASIFSEFGNVTYVSIPKYKHNKVNKGFAFVEFEKEQEAQEALDCFESLGCKMSLLTPPETLCSIVTFEGKDNNGTAEITGNAEEPESVKKRKHSTEEGEDNKKKFKADDTKNGDNMDDSEEKKKRKHKKGRKKMIKELGLQVLSKVEWKKIRNRYLDDQKAKMKQLKQFLYRKKFGSNQNQVPSSDGKRPKLDKQQSIEKMDYIPGVIVKIHLTEPYPDLKSMKDDFKQYSTEIKYIDVAVGATEGHLRFADSDSAQIFCSTSEYKGRAGVLKGADEDEYWQRIDRDRSAKFEKNQKKRVRGRDKLLRKAEKELGKHIKFDDTD